MATPTALDLTMPQTTHHSRRLRRLLGMFAALMQTPLPGVLWRPAAATPISTATSPVERTGTSVVLGPKHLFSLAAVLVVLIAGIAIFGYAALKRRDAALQTAVVSHPPPLRRNRVRRRSRINSRRPCPQRSRINRARPLRDRSRQTAPAEPTTPPAPVPASATPPSKPASSSKAAAQADAAARKAKAASKTPEVAPPVPEPVVTPTPEPPPPPPPEARGSAGHIQGREGARRARGLDARA